ncbi:hypothetical protein [Agrococcus sp. SGAir0287]|uniref:hypothetical protein n=1 Tax=Agrococcus sp. SGAir0287 TaxID=2070347 RepID=UPI0010CD26B1|nr:hypothetical protein [Agrococcus sp. SGAir0287]QCR20181.1 hypothetical protein C1N71_12640 [Agrococcus sp. SGAir0287]
MHRRSSALVVAALAATLTACVIQPPPLPSPVEAWRVDDRLVTMPHEESGTLVAYTTAGPDSLEVVAWDGADGTELWRVPSAPLASGRAAEIVPLDDGSGRLVVPVLVPEGDAVRWSVRDLLTGEEQAWSTSSADGTPASWEQVYQLWRCGPEQPATSLCFSVPDGTETTAEFLRIRPGHGVDLLPVAQQGSIFATQLGLYTDRSTQTIDLMVDGAIRWSRPWADAFSHVFADGAIDVRRAGDLLLVTSAPGWFSRTLQLESIDTVALDVDSGAVRWRVEGAMPCTDADSATILLCEMGGTDDDSGTRYTSVAVVGTDLATGEERWRATYPESGVEMQNGEGRWSWFSPVHALLPDEAGQPVVVDVATGQQRAVPVDAPLPCAQGGSTVAWTDGALSIPIAELPAWCDASGTLVAEPEVDPVVLEAITTRIGDTWVMATPSGLVGYRLG